MASVGLGPRWVCSRRCGGGVDGPECPPACWMCGARLESNLAPPLGDLFGSEAIPSVLYRRTRRTRLPPGAIEGLQLRPFSYCRTCRRPVRSPSRHNLRAHGKAV